jgi:UPF0271 protein
MPAVDLNCDLGEGAAHDAELMSFITSASIACGGHAGDEDTMRATLRLALEHGVAIGAHPGFADPKHFGRVERPVMPEEMHQLVFNQTRLLQRIAGEEGARLAHVKLHGALYNMAARNSLLAEAAAHAVYELDPRLVLFGLAGSAQIRAGEATGLAVAHEVFADRTYQADGSLTPRAQAGALIEDEALAVAQALRMVREGQVRAVDGADVAVRADTICLHGDGPKAVAFARRLKKALADDGVELRRPAG